MKESKHVKVYLILGLIYIILFTHLPVFYTIFYHSLTDAPTAVDGSINLKTLSPDRTIILDGSWEFFWNRLIVTEPQQDDKSDFFIKVPDYWSKYKIDGKWLTAEGFASYRLTLQGLKYSQPVTVYLPDFGCAYRVFIDGVRTAESGIVSKNINEIHTVPKAKLYPVTLSPRETHEIVIEVASTRFSGLYMAPVLKDYERTIQENNDRGSIRLILFGTVLFSFFVLTVVYMLSSRRGLYLAWLPAMSFLVLMRLMLTTEFYSFWQSKVFFNLSYEDTNELMFLATFILKFLMIFMIQRQFGVAFSRKEKYGFFLYYTVIYLVYYFTPHGFYNRHLTIILPVSTFLLEFYSFFKIYNERHQMKRLGILVYCGSLLALSGLIIDCYYINGNIYINMSLALIVSLSVQMTILSIVYALRIAELYNDYAISSIQLSQAKQQIAIQKEYYDALSERVNEILEIKHDIRHFIGVINGLCENGRYDELKHFLSEYEDIIETEPLPIFCENVVANSILGYYSLMAKKAGIQFYCTCSIQRQLSVNDADLCVVLGNAVENAIEACTKLDNPEERFISVEARTKNSQLLIKIENSYNGCLNIRNGDYISTKNEKFHGLGIKNVKRVVEAYGGFIKTEHNERTFILMVAFPMHKKTEDKPANYKGDGLMQGQQQDRKIVMLSDSRRRNSRHKGGFAV
ncbi:MAG TPA: GHKL domain-containing protein [Clostridiaceae bacterium]|nr:GHKL domain-containing protein [Clostridiaceae bacterium]